MYPKKVLNLGLKYLEPSTFPTGKLVKNTLCSQYLMLMNFFGILKMTLESIKNFSIEFRSEKEMASAIEIKVVGQKSH